MNDKSIKNIGIVGQNSENLTLNNTTTTASGAANAPHTPAAVRRERAKCDVKDPYIFKDKHLDIMKKRVMDYFAAYNEVLKYARKYCKEQYAAQGRKPVLGQEQDTAIKLLCMCMHQLSVRRRIFVDRKGKPNLALLHINSLKPYVLFANRVSIKNLYMHGSNIKTVANHLNKLEESGFITMHVNRGTRANFELHIHPYFLLISDLSNAQHNPLEQCASPPALVESLHLTYNFKENYSNPIMKVESVKNCSANSQNPHAAKVESIFSGADIVNKPVHTEKCPTKEKESDGFNTNLQNSVKKCENIPRKIDALPKNCRDCTDYGMVGECKNCPCHETLKMSELGSFWLDCKNSSDNVGVVLNKIPAGKRWGKAEKRKDADSAFRRRFYVTMFLAYALGRLFPKHELFDGEKRKVFQILLERKDVYFKDCLSVEQYEWEFLRMCERINLAHEYSVNHCFSMVYIFPSVYFAPESKSKCNFRSTESWLKVKEKRVQERAKLKKWYKERLLLHEVFASLRDNPALENYLRWGEYVHQNIPQCERTLNQFWKALMFEYNVLLNPNKNEYSKTTWNFSVPDGNPSPQR